MDNNTTIQQYIDQQIQKYMDILAKRLERRLDLQGERQDDWLRQELQKLKDEIDNLRTEMEVIY